MPYPTDGFYTGVISNDSTATLEFETTFDFSAFGEYTIDAWTELENDADINNDSFSFTSNQYSGNNRYSLLSLILKTGMVGGKSMKYISVNNSWAFGEPVGPDISERC